MPTHVKVYHEPTFTFLVQVKSSPKYCECSVLEMNPIAFMRNTERIHKDETCGRIIPHSHVIEYDKYFGFNGYDEVHDCE